MSSHDSQHPLLIALYSIVTRDDGLPAMLSLLGQRFGCRSAAFIYVDRVHPAADVVQGHGAFDREAQERYRTRFAHIDPLPAIMARLPVGEAAASDRLFAPEAIDALPFIREYYHPLGLREALGGPIVNESGRFGIVAVHRGPERDPFTDAEIRDFERLIPHLAQVVALRRTFFEIAADAANTDAALDATATAVLVLDADGVLRRANAAARALLARGDALTLTPAGRLRAVEPEANRHLAAILRDPTSHEDTHLLSLPRAGEMLPCALRVLRRASHSGRFIVHVSDPDRATADPAAILIAALDLPLAGARLVAALVSGEDLAGYAGRTGLSVNTVKFHLKAAFAATGTRRQADLVRIATGILRDLGG